MSLTSKTTFKTTFVSGTGSSASRQGTEGHATIHNNIGSVLNNLQDDVGVDGSSDANSLKYQIENTANANRIIGKTVGSSPADGQYLKYASSTDTVDWDTPSGAGDMLSSVYDPANVNEQLVGATATQTLTNKRLTSPKLNENVAVTATATEVNVLDGIPATLTATELGYSDGVTSAIQTQLNAKAATGANSDITSLAGLTTPLTVAQGGTGAATLTGILKGSGTSAFTAVAAPTGTIVGTSDTQELSNKTHDGDFNLKNATDNIKVAGSDPSFIIWSSSFVPLGTSGCGDAGNVELGSTNKYTFRLLDFDKDSDEYAGVYWQMPANWDGGTILFRVIWNSTAGGSAAETVNWNLSGIGFADDDAVDTAIGTGVAVSDTYTATGDINITAWSAAVTLSNTPAAGDLVYFKLLRDVSEDNLGGDARLIGVQIKYTVAQYSN